MFRAFIGIFLTVFSTAVLAVKGYYQWPDTDKDTLVLVSEGDIWVVPERQGEARRLTSHAALESQPKLSPDGKTVAFVANYDGADEVYVMAVSGGATKRVSFDNSSVKVQGWTPDGQVLFATQGRSGPRNSWVLKTVDPKTLKEYTLPLSDADEGSVDDKGEYVYFSRFGLRQYRENARTYRGGAQGELWRWRLGSDEEAQKLSGPEHGNARNPMVQGKNLYFISDASGVDNLWSMPVAGGKARQLTRHEQFAVRSAGIGGRKIVYQVGADILEYDLRRKKTKTLDISLTGDLPSLRERWVDKPLEYFEYAHMAADKRKVAITARGRVAIANPDGKRLVKVPTPVDSRTRAATLSPDGRWLYVINDASGEQEIWRYPTDGSFDPKQLTHDGNVQRWNLSVSPDGKYIAHDDKNGNLWLLNTENYKNERLMDGLRGFSSLLNINWSPDSRYLAIAGQKRGQERNQVILQEVDSGRQQTLTGTNYDAFDPVFSPDGNWLYFLSARQFYPNPGHPFGDRTMGTQFDRRVLIFALALTDNKDFPFLGDNELDELAEADEATKADDADENHLPDEADDTSIVWEGLSSRLWQVPVSSGNYYNLQVNNSYLYVIDRTDEPGSVPELKAIKLKPKTKVDTFGRKIGHYQLSADGKQMFVLKTGPKRPMYIVHANGKLSTKGDSVVATRQWQMAIDPKLEYQQLFHDAWLMHRDTLFDKAMRGLDWAKVQQKYAPLLARVTDRRALNDVIGQMTGELNTLHSQIRSGDVPEVHNRPNGASLGATLAQTDDGVKIERIYQHDPELPWQAPPLALPQVDAEAGDLIVAVNGVNTETTADITHQLRNQAGRSVLLTLKRGDRTVKTLVKPVGTSSDRQLRYKDWVWANKQKVDASGEDIGYMHLSHMGSSNLTEFAQRFYNNYQRQGLIIDVRRNSGGSIDSFLIERLLRRAWMHWKIRTGDTDTNMQQSFRGHLVVLADQGSYSDGETFAAGIKQLKLGPVIGKRTFGAGVWLTDRNRLSDGGMARAAEYAQFAMDGRWIIEGQGVSPDIEVDNPPHATFKGEDAQLARAIAWLKDKIAKEPVQPLKQNPFPSTPTRADEF